MEQFFMVKEKSGSCIWSQEKMTFDKSLTFPWPWRIGTSFCSAVKTIILKYIKQTNQNHVNLKLAEFSLFHFSTSFLDSYMSFMGFSY